MANLTESGVWEDGVYRLETTDPTLGGPPIFQDGVPITGWDNAQAQQLANRTKYLKTEQDTLRSETLRLSGGSMVGVFRPATYTLSTLPSVTGNERGLIWVSDLTAGAFFCYCDGAEWRRLDDKTTAS